ncbi:MAG: 2-oxo-4-hydroxy-4-carboxy-5-ureidoimidazoline decarboxylase, partial [Gemmatimonadales bacterium]
AGPLLERLAGGEPYRGADDVIEAARRILADMTEPEKIAVINGHPRIGEAPAVVRALSEASFREQAYDRDAEPPEVMAELARLNGEYERKFGFRFVVFVNRRRKADIIPLMCARLLKTRAQEMDTALGEILAIAADRLTRA